MKQYIKNQIMRIRVALMLTSKKRTQYLIKKRIFKEVGENFFFQPRLIPADPKLIAFHNNVVVSSNVTFVNHDILHTMLPKINSNIDFKYYTNCIEIMDNVYIGCNVTILPNVRIGPNAIVAAGSVVTKDVPENSVVAGNPAKVIKTLDEYIDKRIKQNDEIISYSNESQLESIWEQFYKERGHNDKRSK